MRIQGGRMSSEGAIAVVRRNTEEVQGKGNYEVFEELLAKDFVDHTPQPGGFTADRDGARSLYKVLRTAFPDFHAEIHLANLGRRSRDHVQNVPRDAPRRILGHSPNGEED